MESLVSTEWLGSELGADDLRIVDASLFLPAQGRDARAEYEAAHIPGAMFLDLASLADSDSTLPNMLPPAHKFASRMQSLGWRSEEHTSELQSRLHLVCRLLLEKKNRSHRTQTDRVARR